MVRWWATGHDGGGQRGVPGRCTGRCTRVGVHGYAGSPRSYQKGREIKGLFSKVRIPREMSDSKACFSVFLLTHFSVSARSNAI